MDKIIFRISLAVLLFIVSSVSYGQAPRLVLPERAGEFQAVSYSKSHNLILTFSGLKDSPIAGSKGIVWDAGSGKQLFQLPGHEGKFVGAEFSRNGKFIVTATWGTVKVWDGLSGKLLYDLSRIYKNDSYGSNSITISDDSRYLVLCTSFGVESYDLATGKKLNTLGQASSPASRNFFTEAAFSHDGKYLILSLYGPHSRISVLYFDSFKVKYTIPVELAGNALVSIDDKKFICRSAIAGISEYRLDDGSLLNSNSYKYTGTGVSYHYITNNEYIVESEGQSPALFESVTGRAMLNKDDPASNVLTGKSSPFFSPDGKYFVTAGKSCMADIYEFPSGSLLGSLKNDKSRCPLKLCAISPDGKSVFAITADNKLTGWDSATFTRQTDFDTDISYHQLNEVRSLNSDGDAAMITNDSTVFLWNVFSKKNVAHLPVKVNELVIVPKAYIKSGTCTGISPDGGLLASLAGDSISIWNIRNQKHLYSLATGHLRNWQHLEFNQADDRLVYWIKDTLLLFDLNKKVLLKEIPNDSFDLPKTATTLHSFCFSPDGKTIAACSKGYVNIWNAKNGDFRFQVMASKKPECTSFTFNHHGDHLLMLSTYPAFFNDKSYATAYDLTTKKTDWQINLKYLADYAKYSPDDQSIVSYDFKRTEFGVLDSKTGKLRFENIRPGASNTSFVFSGNSEQLLVSYDNGQIRLFDVHSGQITGSQDVPTGKVSVDYGEDSKYIICGSMDDEFSVWDDSLKSRTSVFFPINKTDYFNGIPSGYYKCTRDAAKILYYVTKNLEVITFDQLDIKYNRPDKVLSALGSPDTALISAYHRAYLKRIEKLNIDTGKFNNEYNVPEAEIRYDQAGSRLRLQISGRDRIGTLDRLNIWVNKVPVYGLKGLSLKNRHRESLDTTISITLSRGENVVEASVINSNGLESYHKQARFTNTAVTPGPEKVYFIGIGTDRFDDVRYNLDWSVKDIRDLAGKLKAKYSENCVVDTLFDQDVSVEKIRALKQDLLRSGVNDKVVIAYSGHGLFSSSWDYYLSSARIDFQNPQQYGIPYEDVENLLDSIPARKKLLLIDACNSGEIDKPAAAVKDLKPAAADLETLLQKAKNNARSAYKSGGVKDQRFFELMQELFVDVRQNTGATIIAASAGAQYAQQKGKLQNGAFTFSLLEFLDQPHCPISKLKQYVNKRVPELTGGLQVPTIRSETDAIDWDL